MTAAIVGSAMVVLILTLRMTVLHRLPKWCFRALWILAAIRLLLPFSLTFEVEVRSDAQELAAEPIHKVISAAAAMSHGAYVTVDGAAHNVIDLQGVIILIYFIGIVAVGGFFLLAYARLYKTARKAEKRFIRGVTVHVGNSYTSPYSCGVIRPIIYIPTHMLTLPNEQLDFIIAHERCHIRRGDQLIKLLFIAAVCVHWYNPLVWVMLRYASRDIELACDETVTRGMDHAEYALCLLAAEEVRSAAPINAFGAPAIKERIECIMKTKHLTICAMIAAAALLAAMTPFFIKVDAVEKPIDADVMKEPSDRIELESEPESAPIEEIDTENKSEEEVETALVVPLASYIITHGVDEKHSAIDLAAKKGAEIAAAMDGTVVTATYDHELGNYAVIEHSDGFTTLYAHCDSLNVAVGDSVTAGQIIATVGQTGAATGPHLHFEIRKDGAFYLPDQYIDLSSAPKRPF